MSEDDVIALAERMQIDWPEEYAMNADINPRAVAGHNQPPVTPFEVVKQRIDDLYLEATGWLDGAPVNTADLAAGVETLEGLLKAAIKDADEARKTEAKPFDDGKAEVQARYNLLIGDTKTVKGTAIRALDACKQALTPWRIEQQRIKDEAARKAREEAERKAAEALAAHRAADAANLAEKEAADALLAEAEEAQKVAKRAEKASTTKTGLRTTYSARIIDAQALAKHVWVNDLAGLTAFLQGWADAAVRGQGMNAKGMVIPGVEIIEHKEAR